MLVPQRVKYRKQQRGRRKGLAIKGSTVSFGQYGIKALEPGWITSRQIEACRVVISREIRKNGKMWTRIFPDKPVTSTPAETRMGKGKGIPEYWVAVIKPGRILFEVESTEINMKRLAEKVSHKLPIKTKLVTRKEY
jgi:large subunit ribosomal protein L16